MAEPQPYTIGFILPFLDGSVDCSIWLGIEREIQKQGHQLITLPGGRPISKNTEDIIRSALYDYINPENFDGFILWGSSLFAYMKETEIQDFLKIFKSKPVLILQIPIKNYPCIKHNEVIGIEKVFEHLVKIHNYKKLSFIRGPNHHFTATIRYNMFLKQISKYKLSLNEKLISPPGTWDEIRGNEHISNLLDNYKFQPGQDFDAVICSNVRQARGVIKELHKRGYNVPQDLGVTGFNDDKAALLCIPSITTSNFNFLNQGKEAVKIIVKMIEKKKVPETIIIEPELIVRNSCGCLDSTIIDLIERDKEIITSQNKKEPLELDYDQVFISIINKVKHNQINIQLLKKFFVMLISNLKSNNSEKIDYNLKDTIYNLFLNGYNSSFLQKFLYEMNLQITEYIIKMSKEGDFYRLLHKILVLIYQAEYKYISNQELQHDETQEHIINIGQQLITTYELSKVIQIFINNFPSLGINYFSFYLIEDRTNPLSNLKSYCFFENGKIDESKKNLVISPKQVYSKEFLPSTFKHDIITLLLYHNNEYLGLVNLQPGPIPAQSYHNFQMQISNTLKGSKLIEERNELLHEVKNKNTELNNALNSLWGEMEIAKKIQTSLLPKKYNIEGYKIASFMKPAQEVGGDYFDIIEGKDNKFWLNIGDVTGHGITSGLIMLILQSSLISNILSNPHLSPRDLILQANEVICYILKSRLMLKHFITASFFKFDKNGHFTFAGAHLQFLIYRHEKKKVELLETPGVWLGIMEDINDLIINSTFKLKQKDVLLLYTDGITECRNAEKEIFEIQRLVHFLEQHGEREPDDISVSLINIIESFQAEQQDDYSFVILRKD